jgi:zinc/manganese transport system ATP-binding protein
MAGEPARADRAGAPPGHGPLTDAAPVELDHVSVRLGGREILTDVELTVDRGEFLAVLGPNGAGKSTLMRAILGLVPFAGGTATVLGRAPAQARSHVGYLPQRHSFDSSVRIRGIDLVRLGLDGTRWGIPLPLTPGARKRRRSDHQRVQEVIELVGAAAYATRSIGELSGGEQQRLLIAQALVRRPAMLILDEPLDGLDLPTQVSVAALLRQIASEENVAVLLVAHDVNPMLGHLDRVLYLAAGHALAGPVDEVITAENLSKLYGAPIEVLRTSAGRLVVVGSPEAPHYHGDRHA